MEDDVPALISDSDDEAPHDEAPHEEAPNVEDNDDDSDDLPDLISDSDEEDSRRQVSRMDNQRRKERDRREQARLRKKNAEEERKKKEEREQRERKERKEREERGEINKMKRQRNVTVTKIPFYDKYVQNFLKKNNVMKYMTYKEQKSVEVMKSIVDKIDLPLSRMSRFLKRGVKKIGTYMKDINTLRSLRAELLDARNIPVPDARISGTESWKSILKAHGPWGQILDHVYTIEIKRSSEVMQSWTSIRLSMGEQREMESLQDDSHALDFDDDRELSETRTHEVTPSEPNAEFESLAKRNESAQEIEAQERVDVGDVNSGEIVNKILLSMHVLKWINRDPYNPLVQVLSNRLRALAEGRTSYCLSKTLKHHPKRRPLWEAKLTSGDRILYSKEDIFDDEGIARPSLLIWYISHHDDVPANIDRIDNSYRRRNYRELEFCDSMDFELVSNKEDLLLVDPAGNNMLRTYSVHSFEIGKLGSRTWKPSLQLTKHELEVVRIDKSVLLLGRGGTGKTYCLCSRIHRDIFCSITPLKCVFVSFTSRLKENVKHIYESMCYKGTSTDLPSTIVYSTVRSITDYFYSQLKDIAVDDPVDFSSKGGLIRFQNFRDEFWPHHVSTQHRKYVDSRNIEIKITPLLAWTQIYSFIKGSVESVESEGSVTLEAYLQLESKRVRLPVDGRKNVYAIFQIYQRWCKQNTRWDQTDFVKSVFKRMKIYMYERGCDVFFNRVYVDEVQDLTQAEIALLLISTKMNPRAFFFAGDTAQSIVAGVSFRFEEVRNAFYKLTGGMESLARTQVLTTNFRSHDGILQVAGCVLDKLNETFKESADKISKNVGLAKGQKPLYLSNASIENIIRLTRGFPRVRLLTWDVCAKQLEAELNEARKTVPVLDEDHDVPIHVFGFKNVKGLEFEDVAVINFFCSGDILHTDEHQQKCWKYLFSKAGREPEHYPPVDMEVNLKILYTAITRTRSRLFFIEQIQTKGSENFFRLLDSATDGHGDPLASRLLANVYNTDEIKPKLPIEYVWEGVELAEQAHGEETEVSLNLLKRSVN